MYIMALIATVTNTPVPWATFASGLALRGVWGQRTGLEGLMGRKSRR